MKRGSIVTAAIVAVSLAAAAAYPANATFDRERAAIVAIDAAHHRLHVSADSQKIGCVWHTADFAVTSWRGRETGGEDILARRGGRWTYVAGGGGALGRAADLIEFGVPARDANALMRMMHDSSAQRRGCEPACEAARPQVMTLPVKTTR